MVQYILAKIDKFLWKKLFYISIIMGIFLMQQSAAIAILASNSITIDSEGLSVNIFYPWDNSEVLPIVEVNGTINGTLQKGEYLWLLINPHSSPREWQPRGRIEPDMLKKSWEILNANVGTSQDSGKKFDIAVYQASIDDDKKLNDWIDQSKVNPNLHGLELSYLSGGQKGIKARITVKRN